MGRSAADGGGLGRYSSKTWRWGGGDTLEGTVRVKRGCIQLISREGYIFYKRTKNSPSLDCMVLGLSPSGGRLDYVSLKSLPLSVL